MATTHLYSRAGRTSTFSDSNLTPLESLVLECALEEAQQQRGATKEAYEMSRQDYEELLKIPGNNVCCDCGKDENTEWCSVSFGIFLCASCSGNHRAMGTHISRVRSIKMDAWSQEHLDRMRQGGNHACRTFLEEHGVNMDLEQTSIDERYSSAAAELYKGVLMGNMAQEGTEHEGSASSSFAEEEINISPVPSSRTGSIAISDSTSLKRLPSEASSTDKSFEEDEEEDETDILHDKTKPESDQSDHEEEERKGVEPKDQLEEATDVGQTLQVGLEKWFSKVKKDATDATSRLSMSIHGSSSDAPASLLLPGGSIHQKKAIPRRSYTVSSSSPTIVYMGRSFSADCEEYKSIGSPNRGRNSLNSISSFKNLTELAQQQELLAKNSTNDAPWKTNLPPNFWTVDKKVEPFVGGNANSADQPNRNSTTSLERHSVHDTVRQHYAFTESDVLSVATDEKEFARLKASLKNRGAVTNEVLKQRLYAFIAKSKRRRGILENRSGDEMSNNAKAVPRRSKSVGHDQLGLAHTIHTSTMSRATATGLL